MLKHLICLSLLFVAAICGCFDNGDKEIGGSCYKFVSQKLSFEDARDWCHYKNPVTPSYLAHVGNQFTANFLASYAKAAFGPSESFFWIGLSRNRSWTPWTWDTGYQAGFTNFGSDALSQNYAAEAISNTKWSTFGDDTKMFFVCSYDPTAPPTFGPPVTVGPTAAPTTTTPRVTTPTVPTTTEEYDDNCNIGEKHSTFLFAYSADTDLSIFNSAKNAIIQSISTDRHNYTKLAAVRFDTQNPENITYYDDLSSFSTGLSQNAPSSSVVADSSIPSNILPVIRSFLGATGRPLESSMIVVLAERWPKIDTDLSDGDYDTITNNNVKVFVINSYISPHVSTGRSTGAFSSLAANSNGHFFKYSGSDGFQKIISSLMSVAYTNSLAFTRNLGSQFTINPGHESLLGVIKIPANTRGANVNFTVTLSVDNSNDVNTDSLYLSFAQKQDTQYIRWIGSESNSNFYSSSSLLLSAGTSYQVYYSGQISSGSTVMLRIWTESIAYHYGSFAGISDPMAWVPLTSVDAYNGTALRMRIMNDCYTEHAGSILITDCSGTTSPKYESSQHLPIDFIFPDESSFPHYPFAPFFCDAAPFHSASGCVKGSENKYDIQFVAGEFTVVRSFQCRPGVGVAKCENMDARGNVYCDRNSKPYMRGPTGQLPDCLGRGHLEFDFNDTQSYICVCDVGYTGENCEISG